MQVVGDHDAVELPTRQRPRPTFNVGRNEIDATVGAELRRQRCVAVDTVQPRCANQRA
jgi:hypothetical protein